MTDSLISEAEAFEHCLIVAKSVGEPLGLSQKPQQNADSQADREEYFQVGCDLGLDEPSQGRKEHQASRHDGRIYIYRKWFETLLASNMSPRDRLIIEYSLLEALRTGEISSLRVNYCDLSAGLIHVLDSKKHAFRLVPYRPIVAKHTATYIQEHHLKPDDILLQSRKKHQRKPDSKCRGVGLTEASIERLMDQCCAACGVPSLNPRDGRAYFATVWHFVKHKSMYHLKAILGHDSVQSTEHYLSRIVDVQDMINEFHEGEDDGLVSGEPCVFASKCHGFQPQTLEVDP